MNTIPHVVMTLTNIDKLGRKFSGTVHEARGFKSYTQFIICLYDNYHVSLPNVLSVFTIELKFIEQFAARICCYFISYK
jgi:hypothetical protein